MEAERDRAELAADYPAWRIWRNGNLVYAWQVDASPPLRLVDSTVAGLREQIKARIIAAIAAEFPGWEVWEHVNGGLWYARRLRSSPALVTKPVPLPGLRDAIVAVTDGRKS